MPPEADLTIFNKRSSKIVIGLLLLAVGGVALAVPWVASSPQWDWTIRKADDLAGAEVIADLIHTAEGGFHLQAQGTRAISLISPPLEGLASGRPCVEVTISRVDVVQSAAAAPQAVTVNLFWQFGGGESFRMESAHAVLAGDGSPARLYFTPPIDASRLHRMGVQVTEAAQIRIHGIRMIDANFTRRAENLLREFSEPEAFGGESVNFYKGPNLLGRGFNYYLIAIGSVALGFVILRSCKTRRPLAWPTVAACVLVPWIIGDAVFSTQLARRALAESGSLRGLPQEKAIRAVYGDSLGLAAEWIEILPIGSRVCVISSDATTASHRLAYLAAPHMIPADRPQDADFIVMLDGNAHLQDERTLVLSESGERLPVRIVERWPGGALLERASN